MQHFITAAGARYDYDDDVKVTITAGVSKVVTAAGVSMVAPSDLQPYTPTGPTLADVKAAKLDALSAACQAQIYAGFSSSALGAAFSYPFKDTDQANLNASVTNSLLPGLAAGWTTPFWCADAAGAWAMRPHTVAQIQKVGTDATAAKLAAINKNITLAAQVNAATTVAAVQAIVW